MDLTVWILVGCGTGELKRIKKENYDFCIASIFEDCGILHEEIFCAFSNTETLKICQMHLNEPIKKFGKFGNIRKKQREN